MIEVDGCDVVFVCDNPDCGQEEAVEGVSRFTCPFAWVKAKMKELAWIGKKIGGKWYHFCSDCVEAKDFRIKQVW